jgi:SAM-dependent methyltransferase
MVPAALIKLKNRLAGDVFGRGEIARWAAEHVASVGNRPAGVLDVGLGECEDLLAIRAATAGHPLNLYGVEFDPSRIARAHGHGIDVLTVNLERQTIPLEDASLDVVLSNHVIEHLKEIFHFFSEVSRVLRPGGIAIIGFPNLGSWHNRIALLFGFQPPCMRVLGSHVRGFTIPGFRDFIVCGGFFRVRQIKGRAFHLAPGASNGWLASAVPGLAVGVHFVLERTEKPGRFIEVLDMGVPGMGDTPYFRGADV